MVLTLAVTAGAAPNLLGPRVRGAMGVACFIGLVAALSANLRAVKWRTVIAGILIQALLAAFVLVSFRGPIHLELFGVTWLDVGEGQNYRPGTELFEAIGKGISKFLEFSNKGSAFVFGPLADPKKMAAAFGEDSGFVFVVSALPPIIFVSSFFSVLYHFGVLQWVVRIMARAMMRLMGTSGAETLSASANVFMGMTEAPLIVKPYVARMTRSELLALMAGGMATVSGGIMAVYLEMGADRVALLATSVMAAPCGLYLSKLLLPEMESPETLGGAPVRMERPHRNAIDAAASGASEGMYLAINVAAMLIAFLALLAMIDYVLGLFSPDLSLRSIFSTVFYPVALLIGVDAGDARAVANLLGVKLSANEFVAFRQLTVGSGLTPGSRGFVLATFALTSFANFGSIAIELGGIGAMAPERRPELARLGLRALFVGYVATLVNTAMVAVLY
jgi:CNT family concentrative nucleoside transporter